jgi:hypothetical protein
LAVVFVIDYVRAELRMPIKLRRKCTKQSSDLFVVIRVPATKVREERRLHEVETRMLRWICQMTRTNRIRTEYIWESIKVATVKR